MAGYYNFAHRGQLTPDAIRAQIESIPLFKSPWGALSGGAIRTPKDNVPSGNDASAGKMDAIVVNFVDDFWEKGTDTMRIPIRGNFSHNPVYGDGSLVGTGTQLQWAQRDIYVAPTGAEFPVNLGPANKLRMKNIVKDGGLAETKNAAIDYFSELLTHDITRAFYEGNPANVNWTSAQLVAAGYAGSEGLGKIRKHHPKIWIANQGWMTFSATHNTYDSTINDGLVTLDADASADALPTPDGFDEVYTHFAYNKVRPAGGEMSIPYWLAYVTPEVYNLLMKNDRFVAINKSAYQGMGEKDPNLSGGALVYRHFVIRANPLIAWEAHHTCTDPAAVSNNGWLARYGAMNAAESIERGPFYLQSVDTADRNLHCTVILGKGAMHIGRAGRYETNVALSDDQREANVYGTIYRGATRCDVKWGTDSASPDNVENFSSAIMINRVA